MQTIGFKINAIENGWFEAEFCTVSKRTAISASNKWGNDSARHLLRFIHKLLSGQTLSGYVSFDEAPGSYILFIDNSGDTAILYVLYSQSETRNWKKLHTHGGITLSDFLEIVPIKEVLLFAEIDLRHLAEHVYKEFAFYVDEKHRASYENHWNAFPVKEFHNLDIATSQNTYSRFDSFTA